MKAYYRVNNPNRALPSSTSHGTQAEAIAKVKENAANHPGEAFEILECIAIVSTTVPEPSVFFMDGKMPEASPEPKPLKLEVGKRYVRRNGNITIPIWASNRHHWAFSCGIDFMKDHFTEDGFVYGEDEPSEHDIIAEYEG